MVNLCCCHKRLSVHNEEPLVIYECTFFHEASSLRRRGTLLVTLNYIQFRSPNAISVCKWGAIQEVDERRCRMDLYAPAVSMAPTALSASLLYNVRRRIELVFVDGSKWILCDFYDFDTALCFLTKFHRLQRRSWGALLPFNWPFGRLLRNCFAQCVSTSQDLIAEQSRPPPQMPPAKPILLPPDPYKGDGWVKKIGGRHANIGRIVDVALGEPVPEDTPSLVVSSTAPSKIDPWDDDQSTADRTP